MYLNHNDVVYSPGMIDGEERAFAHDMDERLALVPKWLSALARELNEPDKWAEWEQAKVGLIAGSQDSQADEPISDVERTRALEGLVELRGRLESIDVAPETLSRVRDLIDVAVVEVKGSSSRIALRYFLLGTLITVVMMFGQSPVVRRACVELLNQFIAKVPFLLMMPNPPVG
jgi:hypothetical protein